MNLSIVIPCYNESAGLKKFLPELVSSYPDAEVIVVDDHSSDDSAIIAEQYGARVISHPVNLGNGAAIKTGARHATGEIIIFMDADGQHKPSDIPLLLERIQDGFDMVVGARDASGQANKARLLANGFYNWFASKITGHQIRDLTSGFRAVRADKFREFLYLLPNGFSYPTTITMSFFRAGYSICYVSIDVAQRLGKSHINLIRDGVRFLVIIFKIGTLYSPLKVFTPISMAFFLIGLLYYLYTFVTLHRFTNMSALMLTTAVIVFLIGLVSEQITTLIYRDTSRNITDNKQQDK